MSWDVAVRAVLTCDAAGLASGSAQKLKPIALPKSLPQAKLECATVGGALELLAKRASYSRTTTKRGTWTLWAVLSEDDYLDHAPTFFAAMARAGAFATGHAVSYGLLTAPEGIAHRMTVGPKPAVTKLSRADEKRLLATRDAKAFEAWIEAQVEQAEAAAADQRALARAATPSLFFADMKEVRPVIEDAMDFIQRADDKALVRVVAKGSFYRFHAKAFKTGASIKKACTAASKHEDPAGAASDMLGLVERLGFRKRGVHGLTHPTWWLLEWAGYLADAPEVATELLGKRLRAGLIDARTHEGAAQLVHYLAAASLVKRQAWSYVPELATACFGHPDPSVRATIAQLFAVVPMPVPIDAPRLDVLASSPDHRGHALIFELHRRLRLEPGRAFDELEPLILAKDHTVANAVAAVLGPSQTWRKSEMSPAEQDAVFAAEPRWKRVRTGAW